MKSDNIVKYRKNGATIICSSLYHRYVITTDHYQIMWNVDDDFIDIFSSEINHLGFMDHLIGIHRKFDMNLLATLKDPIAPPALLEITHASSEHIEHQIARILRLKAFL